MTAREDLLRRIEALEEKAGRIEVLEKENAELHRVGDERATELVELRQELAKVEEIRGELLKEVNSQRDQIQGFAGFRDALRAMVGDILEERVEGITQRLEERFERLAGQATVPGSKLEVDVEQSVLEVNVHRETVTAEESTLRGQIALLIAEGALDSYRSARSIGRDLIRLGVKISEKNSSIIEELNWFTQQRILLHDDKQGWKVADKSRVKVKES